MATGMKPARQILNEVVNNADYDNQSMKKFSKKEGTSYVFDTFTYQNPDLDVETISNYARENVFYGKIKTNQRNLIFPDAPEFAVYNADGELDEEATDRIKRMALSKRVNIWINMQRAWSDVFDFGAGFFNPVWKYNGSEYVLEELNYLPAETFDSHVGTSGKLQDDLLNGVILNDKGEMEFYQTDLHGQPVQLQNVFMVKDPMSKGLAGTPLAQPILPLISAAKFTMNAQMQKVNRIGSPPLFISIENPKPPSPENNNIGDEEYAQMVLENYSKDYQMPIRDNMTLHNNPFDDNSSALDTIEFINKLIIDYWTPSSLIAKDGTLIGGSSASEMSLLMRYVSSIHEWLEDAFENLLQTYLDANGYQDYTIDIKIPEPEVDTSDLDLKRAEMAAQVKSAVKVNEFRRFLGLQDDENFKDQYLSDVEPEQVQGMMSGMQNIQNTEEKPTPKQAEDNLESELKDPFDIHVDEILEAVDIEKDEDEGQ